MEQGFTPEEEEAITNLKKAVYAMPMNLVIIGDIKSSGRHGVLETIMIEKKLSDEFKVTKGFALPQIYAQEANSESK